MREETIQNLDIQKEKKCTGCLEIKLFSDFGFKKTESRYESRCKECKRSYSRKKMRDKRAKAKKKKDRINKKTTSNKVLELNTTEFEYEVFKDDKYDSRRKELKLKIGDLICQNK